MHPGSGSLVLSQQTVPDCAVCIVLCKDICDPMHLRRPEYLIFWTLHAVPGISTWLKRWPMFLIFFYEQQWHVFDFVCTLFYRTRIDLIISFILLKFFTTEMSLVFVQCCVNCYTFAFQVTGLDFTSNTFWFFYFISIIWTDNWCMDFCKRFILKTILMRCHLDFLFILIDGKDECRSGFGCNSSNKLNWH